MKRRVAGVIVGLMAGVLAVALLEGLSSLIYPPPADLDFGNSEAVGAFYGDLPIPAFLIVLAAHACGAMMGGFACAAMVRERWPAGSLMVGSVLLIGGAVNLLWIPHPIWFSIADLILYLPTAVVGGVLANELFAPRPTQDARAPVEIGH